MNETPREFQKRLKKAEKLLGECDYTPAASKAMAGPLCILLDQPIYRKEQVITTIGRIIRGK